MAYRQGILLKKCVLDFGHLEDGDAQRPDVGLVGVAFAQDELGRHPERATNLRPPPGFVGVQEGADAKIGQLDLTLLVEQYVSRLAQHKKEA